MSEEERIVRHKRFLVANWPMLAAFSWEYYLKQGRGAVVVDERDFIYAGVPQYTKIHLRYVAENTPLLTEIGGWPGDREAGWVKTYDPDARVVLLIVRESGGTSGYLAGTNPPNLPRPLPNSRRGVIDAGQRTAWPPQTNPRSASRGSANPDEKPCWPSATHAPRQG